jgi:hypothetical protein
MPKKKTSSKKTTKSAKAAKKPAEKKDKKMMQTHAKEEKFVKTTLDQVWGDTGNTRYGTIDEATYLNKLKEMNTTDLQAHAHMHGLVPIQDRGRLTKVLMGEFRRYTSSFKAPNNSLKSPSTLEVSAQSKKTLSEGR